MCNTNPTSKLVSTLHSPACNCASSQILSHAHSCSHRARCIRTSTHCFAGRRCHRVRRVRRVRRMHRVRRVRRVRGGARAASAACAGAAGSTRAGTPPRTLHTRRLCPRRICCGRTPGRTGGWTPPAINYNTLCHCYITKGINTRVWIYETSQ